jgi:c-di-GMP-binding flagellar brake protein YcgR
MMGYDDNRNFFRMMVNSPCEVVVSDNQSTRTLTSVCKDLSATGMSLEVEESVEIGATAQVSIESTSSQIPSLNANVKVIRCTASNESSYILGVEIVEMK